MAKFKKKIVKPGVYKTGKNKDTLHPLSEQTLAEIAKTSNDMIEAGLRIPAPFAHKDQQGIVPAPLMEQEGQNLDAKTKDKQIWNSGINGGFWDKFEIDDKDGSLVGVVDAPGDENDINSPAGKLGKTVKETSMYLVPEFEDGLGRKWKNALWHVALVNNPVEPGQENFEVINNTAHEQELAVAMAISMADEVNGDTLRKKKPVDDSDEQSSGGSGEGNEGGEPSGTPEDKFSKQSEEDPNNQGGDEFNGDTEPTDDVGKLVSAFLEIGVILPDDTDDSNIVDRLLAIIPNLSNKEMGGNTLPEGSKVQSSPIAMSKEIEKNDDPNLVLMQKKADALLSQHISGLKKQFKARIDTLIRKGQVGRKYADEALLPQVEAIAMSMEDLTEDNDEVSFPKLALEMALDTLEHNVELTDNSKSTEKPDGNLAPEAGDMSAEEDISSEDMDALYDEASI